MNRNKVVEYYQSWLVKYLTPVCVTKSLDYIVTDIISEMISIKLKILDKTLHNRWVKQVSNISKSFDLKFLVTLTTCKSNCYF